MAKRRLRDLRVDEVSIVKRGANSGSRVLLHKSDEESMNPVQRIQKALTNAFTAATRGIGPDGAVLTSEDEQSAVIKSQIEEVAEALDMPAPEAPAATPETPVEKTRDEILKGLSPEAVAIIEKAEADAKIATDQLAKVEGEQATVARVAKATELLGKLAGKPEELADVLKALDEPQVAVLTQILKGANAQATSVVTEEIGKSGAPVAKTLDTATAAVRAANPSFTNAEAVTKALADDPTLYDASLAAQKE